MDWARTLLNGRPRKLADLLRVPRSHQAHELWVIIVDASASTRRDQALARAKGLLKGVFASAYRQRARVALMTATGNKASWQFQGLKAAPSLQPWIDQLGAGGGTPLLAAIEQARAWLMARQRRTAGEQQRVLVVTDGRLKAWSLLMPLGCTSLVVDIERAAIRLGRARQLAAELGADYRHIDELPSGG